MKSILVNERRSIYRMIFGVMIAESAICLSSFW